MSVRMVPVVAVVQQKDYDLLLQSDVFITARAALSDSPQWQALCHRNGWTFDMLALGAVLSAMARNLEPQAAS